MSLLWGDSDLASENCLPIFGDSWRIKEAVKQNTVVAIKAEPGSGKTMLGAQCLRQEVGSWPVLIVQKSCCAAEMVLKSLVESQNLVRRHLHLHTGLHDTDVFCDANHSGTQYSVITYGILYEWFKLSWIFTETVHT